MKRVATTVSLALLFIQGGPEASQLRPIFRERIIIASTPVVLDPADPSRTRVGALTLVGGWRLTSQSSQFGGWSALHVQGDRVTAIGDAGAVLQFRLGRFGNAYDASIMPLPAGCSRAPDGDDSQTDKRSRDSESLARHDDTGDWWVGFEWTNTICRVSPDFGTARARYRPPAMRDWPRQRGPESMLVANGHVIVLAEGTRSSGSTKPLLVFDRDPTDPAAASTTYAYQPPDGYAPADMVALPDGRWLIVNRRFALGDLFTDVLTLVDPRRLRRDQPLTATPLARFAPPVLHDNFEGLSITREQGRTFLWMVSDDNFMSWQATYLLKFAVELPPRGSVRRRRSSPSAPLQSSASAVAR